MSFQVSLAFATAVENWYALATAEGTAAATGLWARVATLGAMHQYTGAQLTAAANAVLNGEATIFGGGFSGMMGGEAGAATLAGIGIGAVAITATVVIVGGALVVHHRNKRDFESTRRDALYMYFRQYWPRYAKFATETCARRPNHIIPAPFTFEEFFANRGMGRTIIPAHF